ncbi:MAG: hypothetical protein QOK46_533 [Microbacteriaceae bacterium]|nr:hypothetical protein [Microbacteriaceae bacterium]MDQ1553455.1 hypothetical protein [Microbacteriaceae bacterium]
MTLKRIARDTDSAMNGRGARKRSTRGSWIFLVVISIVSWFFLASWFWMALTAAAVILYRVFGRSSADSDALSANQHWSPPNPRHLLWVLPLGILVCAAWWWFDAGLWNYGGYYRLSKAEIAAFNSSSVKNYIGTALIGSIPILAANWSRTLWPRLTLTGALIAVNLISASIFVLAPRVGL